MTYKTRIHDLRIAAGVSKLQIKKFTGISMHVITALDNDHTFIPKDVAAKTKIEVYLEMLLRQKEAQISAFNNRHGYQHLTEGTDAD